ncbi:hypothetical protein [Nostoc sp.]|uniref:hypothetical protein n=1 Tax=Nostoc sp. TaxID=1180 RepID=UPI002FF9C158
MIFLLILNELFLDPVASADELQAITSTSGLALSFSSAVAFLTQKVLNRILTQDFPPIHHSSLQ